MSKIDPNLMHADFNKRHEVSPCSSSKLHSRLGIQSTIKCPENAAFQVKINRCIYPNLKITLRLEGTPCWMSKLGVHQS